MSSNIVHDINNNGNYRNAQNQNLSPTETNKRIQNYREGRKAISRVRNMEKIIKTQNQKIEKYEGQVDNLIADVQFHARNSAAAEERADHESRHADFYKAEYEKSQQLCNRLAISFAAACRMYGVSWEYQLAMNANMPEGLRNAYMTYEDWMKSDTGPDFVWKTQHEVMLQLKDSVKSADTQKRLQEMRPFSAVDKADPVSKAYAEAEEKLEKRG